MVPTMIAPYLLVLCFLAQETGPPVIRRGPKPPRKADETKPPVFVGPNIPAAADNTTTSTNTSANDNAILFPGWPPLLVRA
ncbi:MAG: hypothetical protein NW208_05825 [Bryobacter sp.]|nr:hypothetical protein [Bryobacter sp.]